MSEGQSDGKDRLTGPLVATTMVLILGALGTSVIMAAAGADPVIAIVIFFGSVLLIGLMLWLLRATPEVGASIYGWVKSREARPAPLDYKPSLRQSGQAKYGTKGPPTADQLRDMKDDLRTWVPNPDNSLGSSPRNHRDR